MFNRIFGGSQKPKGQRGSPFSGASLLQNPMWQASMGLLGARQDARINPWMAMNQGLLNAQQQKDMQQQREDAELLRQDAERARAQGILRQQSIDEMVKGLQTPETSSTPVYGADPIHGRQQIGTRQDPTGKTTPNAASRMAQAFPEIFAKEMLKGQFGTGSTINPTAAIQNYDKLVELGGRDWSAGKPFNAAQRNFLLTQAPGSLALSFEEDADHSVYAVDRVTGKRTLIRSGQDVGAGLGDYNYIKGQVENALPMIQQAKTALGTVRIVQAAISKAMQQAGALTTGFTGSIMSQIRGSEAFDLGETIKTIMGNIGLEKLNELRANSQSGASGLGQLSIKEFEALQKSLASLEQSQSKSQLLSNLSAVNLHFNLLAMRFDESISRGQAILKARKVEYPYRPANTTPGTGAAGW